MSGVRTVSGGVVFTPADIAGFTPPKQGHEPKLNVGVQLHPMLTNDRGDRITLMAGTIDPSAEIAWELHADWTETIYILAGEVTCTIDDGDPIRIGPDQLWHVEPGHRHLVANTGTGIVRFLILFGA